jgi:BMFP domain-containing protein YqiC
MQSQNRFFDDIARVASGAVGAISGVRGEIEARLRDQLERVLAGMDLVSREEFEAVKAMAAKARTEQELLQARIEALEARLAGARKTRNTRSSTQSPEVKNDRQR